MCHVFIRSVSDALAVCADRARDPRDPSLPAHSLSHRAPAARHHLPDGQDAAAGRGVHVQEVAGVGDAPAAAQSAEHPHADVVVENDRTTEQTNERIQ